MKNGCRQYETWKNGWESIREDQGDSTVLYADWGNQKNNRDDVAEVRGNGDEEGFEEMLDDVMYYAGNKQIEEEHKKKRSTMNHIEERPAESDAYNVSYGKGWNSEEDWQQHTNWLNAMWNEAWTTPTDTGGEIDVVGKGKAVDKVGKSKGFKGIATTVENRDTRRGTAQKEKAREAGNLAESHRGGKGTGLGANCYNCGNPGHIAANCPKGKGKGGKESAALRVTPRGAGVSVAACTLAVT